MFGKKKNISKFKKELIDKIESIDRDEDVLKFLDNYVRIMKSNKDTSSSGSSVSIGYMFQNCVNLNQVTFPKL
jgi:hypothetical protein